MKLQKAKAMNRTAAGKVNVYHRAFTGMSEELESKIWDLEAKMEEAEAEGKPTLEYAAEMEKLIQGDRDAIRKNREEYAVIRRETIPVPQTGQQLTTGGLVQLEGPVQHEIGGIYAGGECPEQSSDFVLHLKMPEASASWGTTVSDTPNGGVIGWSTSSSNPPRISNINGKGRISGYLDLVWVGFAPADDVYIMQPRIPMKISGECFADGYAKPGVDAKAYAELFTFVTVGGRSLIQQGRTLAGMESRIMPDSDYFLEYPLILPDRICFYAEKDQEVRILVRLQGITWTRGRGDAEVSVDFFGVMCNTIADTDIQVKS